MLERVTLDEPVMIASWPSVEATFTASDERTIWSREGGGRWTAACRVAEALDRPAAADDLVEHGVAGTGRHLAEGRDADLDEEIAAPRAT